MKKDLYSEEEEEQVSRYTFIYYSYRASTIHLNSGLVGGGIIEPK